VADRTSRFARAASWFRGPGRKRRGISTLRQVQLNRPLTAAIRPSVQRDRGSERSSNLCGPPVLSPSARPATAPRSPTRVLTAPGLAGKWSRPEPCTAASRRRPSDLLLTTSTWIPTRMEDHKRRDDDACGACAFPSPAPRSPARDATARCPALDAGRSALPLDLRTDPRAAPVVADDFGGYPVASDVSTA
jgi:hypothetical protein